jgi:hypothetical protein
MKNLNLSIDEWLIVQTALRQKASRARMYAKDAFERGDVGEQSGYWRWTRQQRWAEGALAKLTDRSNDVWTPDPEA